MTDSHRTSFRLSLALVGHCLLGWAACGDSETNMPTGVTPTSRGASSAEITIPTDMQTVTSFEITVEGTYQPAGLTDSNDIWIIVWPALAGGKGFPQSPEPQVGAPAVIDRLAQRWSTPATLGGPNQTYKISVHTANIAASRALREYLIRATDTGDFGGLLPEQLPQPPDLLEHDSISITKMEPPVNLRITAPVDGAGLAQREIVIRGRYSPPSLPNDRDIWIVVWPELAGGKGYPQSSNAALGDPALIIGASQAWSVPVTLGGPPQSYRISAHTSDRTTSSVLRDYLIMWARDGHFPGLLPHEIPTGLEERASITIRKTR